MLAQSKQMLETILNAKNKDSFHKLPNHDVKCHGNKKDGSRDDLIKMNIKTKESIMIKFLTHRCLMN